MRMILGLGSFLAFGALWLAVIAWLCRLAGAWSRRIGVLLAIVVASYCSAVALILVIGAIEAGDSLRLGGILSVVAHAVIACGAVLSIRLIPNPKSPILFQSS
jgi:hypothetical protein